MVLEKTLESPLDCKEIQPVYPKGNQSWVFIDRTDLEAETPIFWSPDAKRSNQSILMVISHEYSLEALMLKLKLQYFDPLMQRPDSLEKTLIQGKVEGWRRRGQ